MEDLWLYFEDPELGYLRWSRYWAYNMHLRHVTNLNGIRSGLSDQCWDLTIGGPITEEELIQNGKDGYVRPSPRRIARRRSLIKNILKGVTLISCSETVNLLRHR